MPGSSRLSVGTILLGIFALVVVIRASISLFPMYRDYWLLDQLLEQTELVDDVRNAPYINDIKSIIIGRLAIENLSVPTSDMLLTQSSESIRLVWTYEVRDHFAGNIDFVSTFQIKKEYLR